MKTKGVPQEYVERVSRDRLGFVEVVVAKQYASEQFIEMPEPKEKVYLGAIWNRTDVTGTPGVVTVRWIYEGLGDERSGGDVYEYAWDATYDTVPIQAHPDFKSWIGVYGVVVHGNWIPYQEPILGNSKKDRGKGNKEAGTPNPLLGVESYLSVGGVWQRRRAVRGGASIEDADVPGDVMDGVGFISADVPGPVPTVPPDRNWLKAPPVMKYRGNAWDISESWLLSGRGGWAEIIYNRKDL